MKSTFSPASNPATAPPTPEEMMNAPISVRDVASMFRKTVSKNEKPYTAAVLKKNNDLVDLWYNSVLTKIANRDGQIPASQAWPAWLVFFEGQEILKSQSFMNRLPVYDTETVRYWIQFLTTKTIAELHDAGTAVVTNAWQYIIGAIRFHFANLKWEHVYSKSTDPLVWHREANTRSALFKGEPMPFDLTETVMNDIKEKVTTLTSIRIEPRE